MKETKKLKVKCLCKCQNDLVTFLSDLDREVTTLGTDFQNLEQLFHSQREFFESEISALKDELKNKVNHLDLRA